ncbi:phosphatase PAP2 family protein [Mycobacteroides stephanolepidis]|uniref:Phosphatase PAP2 family protein n=1 Tax=[Mycobacterium] stephanolepidis TaxID=1520670 RepID=A0A1Z4EY21_9MYCO|nr:phosphatase PAP2 family protein [[Mycobacterium] stephanolepidis]BAX97837.1 phosphatase PAP2 family protein [[Mycobacterium] stephanolepidis]
MAFNVRNLRPETTSTKVAAVLATALFVVFATLAVTARHYDSGTAVDHHTLGWLEIHRHGWLTAVAVVVTHLGSPTAVSIATVVAALMIWRFTRSARTAATVAVAVAAAFILAAVAKWTVGEHRPPGEAQLVAESGWSFPSGHVTGTAALAGMLTVVVAYRYRDWRRQAALLGTIVAVLAVAGSRLYLGDHWMVDVLAGIVLSTAVVTIAAAVLHRADATAHSPRAVA